MSKQLRIWLFVLLGMFLTSLPVSSQWSRQVIKLDVSNNYTSHHGWETIRLSIVTDDDNSSISGVEEPLRRGSANYTVTDDYIYIYGNIEALYCSDNNHMIKKLQVFNPEGLRTLDCQNNNISDLKIWGSSENLIWLNCSNNYLTSLDLSSCTALKELNCASNRLNRLSLPEQTALTTLNCPKNQLTDLDVSKNTALTALNCSDNQLTSLNVSGCTALTKLDCSKNQLTSLEVSGCTALTKLDCSSNRLTSLDVSGCTALTKLDCSKNQLTSLNVSSCTALTELNFFSNKLTSLDLTGCTALTTLDCSKNQLTSLDLMGCTALTTLDCSKNQLTSLDVSSCTALKELYCWKNQLTNLDLSQNTALTTLYCQENQLSSLDVSGCTALTTLDCRENQLTNLDLSQNTALRELHCNYNQLTSLDLTGCISLAAFTAPKGLTSLNLSGCTSLTRLDCYDNELTSLNLTGCISLKVFTAPKGLTSLNLSGCTSLTELYCPKDSSLTSLNVLACINLNTINCVHSGLDGKAMSQVISDLPDRNGKSPGTIEMWFEYARSDKTFAYQYDVEVAKKKNWRMYYNPYTNNGLYKRDYIGAPNPICSVTKSVEGKGSLSITGADNLDVVVYGTRLTISATPAPKYELVSLTANGVDISSTKSFVVKDTVTIKAVFGGHPFNVVLEQEGEGELSVTGVDNLDEVPYGTELTIIANPKKGHELTSLIANGINITDTKKVTVRGDLTIKATFTKKNFAVTFEKVGEGTITATGASNLNSVAYGTELTINATPAEGYELVSITAGGADITASKKVVVTDNMIVKATFTKKSFAVSLTKEGEGTITATGASDLNSVAYGTELTINATPADGYELTALTANGTDILATKKIVVEGNLTVKATFTKKRFAVSLTKEGEGTITATGATNLNSVAYGTELTINATPAEGYELTALTANGTDILATKKIVVKDNLTVKATFKKKSFAVSLTKEGEGTISATGASNLNSVAYDTELTIVATPAEGYELVSITAGGTDITASKKVVVTGNLTVKATFTKKSFAVSLTKEGEGTISATGASNLNSVTYGTELTIVATPAEGYELVSITANGTDITATKKIVVTDNLTVKATFAKKSFAVSLTKEGEGTITATGASNLNSVAYGTELTINATPAEGYELVCIAAGGSDITASKKVVVTDNLTVKATFAKKNFAVTFEKVGEGTITATGATSLDAVAYGTELTIVATPAEGYELVSITANGTDITASKKVVVTGNLTVKATFTKKSFAVSLTKEGEGTITATGASNLNSVAYGTELTINTTPADGYELTALTANGTDILATKKVVVTGNLTVKATFAKKSFAVSLTKEGEGTITATGASNLNSVAYGTELTINTTPADGYELTALTANGTDILATKKVVVTGNLTVKATFTKKTFAVTLTSNEHGDITIVEPVDLEAVPYGTTLTVKATGKNAQCVLTELTANGKDILATQSFVVTDVTEVKATFVDHTGVETTVTQQTQLYPNPATDYVIVEGVAPASEVTLHSMTGERLYAGRADDRGTLQIDLTPYADGVYLVCVAGETYRVVVRH